MATIPEIVTGSIERVLVAVTPPRGVDPTMDVVRMAFMPAGQIPDSGDMKLADWDVPTDGATTFVARCLTGPAPGTGQLDVGLYHVFIKVTDNPEIPIKPAGIIKVI